MSTLYSGELEKMKPKSLSIPSYILTSNPALQSYLGAWLHLYEKPVLKGRRCANFAAWLHTRKASALGKIHTKYEAGNLNTFEI